VLGLLVHRQSLPLTVATLVLAPVTTVLHSIGALWGLVSPPETFEVTEKVAHEEASDTDPSDDPGETPTDALHTEDLVSDE
jgi:hypothetical protein